MTLGENLRAARKAAGYKTTEMAIKIGISTTSYQRYENNSRTPKVDVIARMAKILDCTVEYLITGEDEESKLKNRVSELEALIYSKGSEILDSVSNLNNLAFNKGYLEGLKKALEVFED